MPRPTDQSLCGKDWSCIATTLSGIRTQLSTHFIVVYHTPKDKSMEEFVEMQILSITGFRKKCEEIVPASFVYDTGNQANKPANMQIIQRYAEVICMMNPNRICFKGENGTLCLSKVKSIRYHDDPDNIGEIFSIVCGNSLDVNADVSFTIIADPKK